MRKEIGKAFRRPLPALFAAFLALAASGCIEAGFKAQVADDDTAAPADIPGLGETTPVNCDEAKCGDDVCQKQCGENQTNCKEDCCLCGDGVCNGLDYQCGETSASCPADCASCGDGICNEGWQDCALDCCGACGDGVCKGGECPDAENPQACPEDCGAFACGNLTCEPGENPVVCIQDCLHQACGNNVCEVGEDVTACPKDCGAGCGDCQCDGNESFASCPIDCGFCGDGYCSNCPEHDESIQSCPQDCCNDWDPCSKNDWAYDDTGVAFCVRTPTTATECDIVFPCTTGDYCENGVCIPGPDEADCDDGDPCTDDVCDNFEKKCVHTQNEAPCDDGDPCSADDTCSQGQCLGGGPTDCDDGNDCTNDFCLAEGGVGCVTQDLADGQPCNKACEPGLQPSCLGGNCECQ